MDNAILFKTARAGRGYFLQQIQGINEDQLLLTPPEAGHNILWNLGHIVYSNAALLYEPCALNSPVPAHYEALFKGGTSPSDWSETPNVRECLELFASGPETLIRDGQAGKFANYTPRQLAPGYVIENAEEAFLFNAFHEGIHLGMVMELRKFIGAGKHAAA
ncbi:MAG: DinB family protein [Candidatus Hydrogenedentales bacterium]